MQFVCITSLKYSLLIFVFSAFLACKHKEVNPQVTTKIQAAKHVVLLYNEALPIENIEDIRVSKDNFFSGKKSLYLTPQMDFSTGFKLSLGKVNQIELCDSLQINLKYFNNNKLNGVKVVWTVDDENGKNLLWKGNEIQNNKIAAWNDLKLGFWLDKNLANKNNVLNIYIWNPVKDEIWIDDFEFKLFGKDFIEQQQDDHVKYNFHYDFESNQDIMRTECIKESEAHSGRMTCNLSDGKEYGIAVKKPLYLFGKEVIRKLSASIWIYPTQKDHDLILTFSCKDKVTGDFKFWQGKSTIHGEFELNKWTKLNSAVNLPFEKFNIDDEMEIGIWNRGKTSILVDDLHIVFGEQPERKALNSGTDLNENSTINEALITPLSFLCDTINTQFLATYQPKDIILTAPFYHSQNGLESIVHIQKEKVQMYCYESQKNKFALVWETKDVNHPLLIKNTAIFAGDFDNDNVSEILIVNKQTLIWDLYHFKNSSWELKTKGTPLFPSKWCEQNKVSVSNSMQAKGKTVLVKSTLSGIETLALTDGKWNVSQTKLKVQLHNHKETDMFFDWNNDSYLKFNTDWRFDLKLFSTQNGNLIQDKNIELSKNKKGLKPKYYEYTKLWTGHFISNKGKQLLVSYLNCADADYDGNNCNSIENNDQFPNGISIYH